MNIFTPLDLILYTGEKTVFLAGSIEGGMAERWQDRAIKLLTGKGITVFNPRRANWDSTWKQTTENTDFVHQVLWELQGLKDADYVIFYFDPNTKAPITLLELGLMAGQQPDKCIVVCNEPFYRKGNVDIVCDEYGVKQVSTLDEAVELIK